MIETRLTSTDENLGQKKLDSCLGIHLIWMNWRTEKKNFTYHQQNTVGDMLQLAFPSTGLNINRLPRMIRDKYCTWAICKHIYTNSCRGPWSSFFQWSWTNTEISICNYKFWVPKLFKIMQICRCIYCLFVVKERTPPWQKLVLTFHEIRKSNLPAIDCVQSIKLVADLQDVLLCYPPHLLELVYNILCFTAKKGKKNW